MASTLCNAMQARLDPDQFRERIAHLIQIKSQMAAVLKNDAHSSPGNSE